MENKALLDELVTLFYVFLWISLSTGLIFWNKYILSTLNFNFPVALTLTHMAVSSLSSLVLMKIFRVKREEMGWDVYLSRVGIIALLFSVSLWLSNAAYLYLTVSFIQMLKAFSIVTVFLIGCLLKTEKFRFKTFLICIWITIGLIFATLGEAKLILVGVVIQVGGILAEATRVQFVQILLTKKGVKMNPITGLYYICPLCFCCLLLPFIMFELPHLQNYVAEGQLKVPLWMFFANSSVAVLLNLSVFLLIGRTSALSYNVAGVIKDWIIIGLSAWIFRNIVTLEQTLGYLVAFSGVMYYNRVRQLEKAEEAKTRSTDAQLGIEDAAAAEKEKEKEGGEREGLLRGDVEQPKEGGGGITGGD